jgi:hypothetical protein
MRLGAACKRPYDGRILLAITGAETSFAKNWGRFQPPSHNAWSWITGTGSWPTYRAAMRAVAAGFCSHYVQRGLTTIRRIGPMYVLGQKTSNGKTAGWEGTVRYGLHAMGGRAVLIPRNPPTKEPKKPGPTKLHGRVVSTHCSHRDLHHNDRGACVRQLQWLLSGQDPAKRRGSYWHFRSKPSGVFGKATILQVQKAKYRLGFPAGSAVGVAGARFRAYLLGRPLPTAYRVASGKREAAWFTKRSSGGKVLGMIHRARYLITQASRIHYTQTMTGPNGRLSMLLYHPRGPPASGDLWADCSGSVEALYIWAGLPDPAGPGAIQRYPGAAVYTGSQAEHGRLVWRRGESLTKLKPGDLIFYGNGAPWHHVTMYLGDGRVFSHGSEDGPYNNSVYYRPDAGEARRYVG